MFVVLLLIWIYAKIVSVLRHLERNVFFTGMTKRNAANIEKLKMKSQGTSQYIKKNLNNGVTEDSI